MKLQLKVYIFGCGSGAGSYISLELVYIPLKRDSDFFYTFPGYSPLFLGCLCDIACTMVTLAPVEIILCPGMANKYSSTAIYL